MTYEQALVALATKTGMSPDDWRDFLACSPDQQRALVRAYADQSWVRSPDTFGEVLAILGVIGTIAGVVSGVAGAASAVAALKSL